MRRHIRAPASPQSALRLSTLLRHGIRRRRRPVIRRRHRILERTPRRKMLALTNAALDFLIPQLLLQTLLLRFAAALLRFLGLHILPVP
jgi:hypothetical protein